MDMSQTLQLLNEGQTHVSITDGMATFEDGNAIELSLALHAIAELQAAFGALLVDVENIAGDNNAYGFPIEDCQHPFHASVMRSRAALKAFGVLKQVLPGLYFVHAQTSEGGNVDLHVRATNVEHAEILWRTHFHDWPLPDKPASIVKVPVSGPIGAIGWEILTESSEQSPASQQSGQLSVAIPAFRLLHTGHNPRGFLAEASRTGDAGIYDEVRISVLDPGKDNLCVADVLVGLTAAGEVRALVTANSEGDGDHRIAIYPLRDVDNAVDCHFQ